MGPFGTRAFSIRSYSKGREVRHVDKRDIEWNRCESGGNQCANGETNLFYVGSVLIVDQPIGLEKTLDGVAEMGKEMARHSALIGALRESGKYLGSNALQPTHMSTTVRVSGNK